MSSDEVDYIPEMTKEMYLLSLRKYLDGVWKELEGAMNIAKTIGLKDVKINDKDVEDEINDSMRNIPISINLSAYDEGVIGRAFVQAIFGALETGLLEFEE